MARKIDVNETRRLNRVNLLSKRTLEEGVVYIKLLDWPVSTYGDIQDKTDRGGLNHRTEGFGIVNSRKLCVTSRDQTSFVPANRAIRVVLYCKNPSTTDRILIRRWWNQREGPILDNGVELIGDSFSPARVG